MNESQPDTANEEQPTAPEAPVLPEEREGFARALSVPRGQVPICGTTNSLRATKLRHPVSIADFRGPASKIPLRSDPGDITPQPTDIGRAELGSINYVEWETAPAGAASENGSPRDTIFTWIGGSQVRPVRPSFPRALAVLTVNGERSLRFPLHDTNGYSTEENGLTLSFEPRREQSLLEIHRTMGLMGVSGFYRLTVPGELLAPGEALRLRVELLDPPGESETVFYVSPRPDALALNLVTLRDEVAQLQDDNVRRDVAIEVLFRRQYPELFPHNLAGERVLVHMDERLHYHPANITALASGELIIAVREAFDHIAIDGRIVLFRSSDGGRSWSGPELMFDLGESDHRSMVITELPNGDWVGYDYRDKEYYGADGGWAWKLEPHSLWGVWSEDKGKTWNWTEPLTVPGRGGFGEVERHLIRLPSGRLLMAANCANANGTVVPMGVAIHASDDDGRSWQFLALLPEHPAVTGGEPTLLHTGEGRIILLARSEAFGANRDLTQCGMLMQSESLDDGRTWSEFAPTPLSSMSSPGHLLRLLDGRTLCTHANRYRGGIYVTASHDDGHNWDTDNTRIVTDDIQNWDACYPSSAQLADGTVVTTWYDNLFGKFFITVLRWQPEQLPAS